MFVQPNTSTLSGDEDKNKLFPNSKKTFTKEREMSKLKPPTVFDPTEHPNDIVKAFDTYIRQWKLWYKAEGMEHIKSDAAIETKERYIGNYFRASIASNARLLDVIVHEYNGNKDEFENASFPDMTKKLRD